MGIPYFPNYLSSDSLKPFGQNFARANSNRGLTDADTTMLRGLGALTAIFGGINAAIGQFYAAKTQQYQLQSQASALQFQSGIDAINAHGAEMNAQSIQEAGRTQVEQYTMRAGQEQA